MNFIKEKILNSKNIRTLVQVISFIAFTGLFTLTYGSLKSIYVCTIEGNFSLVTCMPQLILVSVVFLLTATLGRFFCGWMCAFGTLMDFLHFISYKITGKSIIVNYKLDQALKLLKYIVLIGSIIFIWTLGVNLFGGSNPWDVFGTYTSFGQFPEFSQYIKSNWLGVGILVIVVLGGLFIERFFCRYLCPLGAIFSILSKLRIIKIKKAENNCGKCSHCSKSCSMGININPKEVVTSGECINCFKCINACPRENLRIMLGTKHSKKIAVVIAILVVSASGIAYYAATYIDSSQATDLSKVHIAELTEQGGGTFTDGTYEGTGSGFKGTTTVSVTVKNGYIKNIETISTGDDMPYYNRAFNHVAEQIISTQNVSIDAMTGATFSSNGIMEAVANALGQEYENNNSQLERGHGGLGYGMDNGKS
ncbi:4Fe-4S binding protein [Aminipila sp.]|uniref:4Fe-4S binding protein n=1 Tax=Aminipila sp. TaxID=2060095 RepID=UPI00289E838D|nr:4Fe-4S binding protein [Aminipila sp.]